MNYKLIVKLKLQHNMINHNFNNQIKIKIVMQNKTVFKLYL